MTGGVFPRIPESGQVFIGNLSDARPFRLAPRGIQNELTNIFARRSAEGDPQPDDHPVFSAWIQRDWTKGMGYNDVNPASDQGSYWKSTADTLYPGVLMPLPTVTTITKPGGGTGNCWVLGDMNTVAGGDHVFVSWGNALYAFNPDTTTWTSRATLPLEPSGKWTLYQSLEGADAGNINAYIPHGTSYSTFNGNTTVLSGLAGTSAVDFATYNDLLFRLDLNGHLFYASTLPSTSTDWTLIATVPDGSAPRHLISYKDLSGNPCLYVVTNKDVFALDFLNQILFTTDLVFPKHPEQGKAVEVKNGALEVSVGMGVNVYDTNTISQNGLDGGDGMPQEFRGAIVDIESAYNGMYALVRGAPLISETPPPSGELDAGPPHDQLTFDVNTNTNYVAFRSDYGWSIRKTMTGTKPTSVYVSDAQSFYALWYACDGNLYQQLLPTMYYNPRDQANDPVARELTAEHESGWYDYGWKGQPKIAKMVEVSMLRADPTSYVQVQVKFDLDSNPWTTLGNANAIGEFQFRLGNSTKAPLADGSTFYQGVSMQRIKLKFVFVNNSGDPLNYPKLEWHQVIVRRYLRPQRQFTVFLDIHDDPNGGENGYTADQQWHFLEALAISQLGIIFQPDDTQYTCDLVALSRTMMSGKDRSYNVNMTLIESFDLGPEDAPWDKT